MNVCERGPGDFGGIESSGIVELLRGRLFSRGVGGLLVDVSVACTRLICTLGGLLPRERAGGIDCSAIFGGVTSRVLKGGGLWIERFLLVCGVKFAVVRFGVVNVVAGF